MLTALLSRVIPDSQRRTLADLADQLDLDAGDARAKRSGYWVMLTLAAVIAAAGVLADSTATVIGAMLISPLSTPIMGMALGLVRRRLGSSLATAGAGSALVVLVGVLFSRLVPGPLDPMHISQIASRTAPGLFDLLAAVATGVAAAVALARRDLPAVLPGVAVAIALVPPLAVVGVCLGDGHLELALGALLLFASNVVALVLIGTLTFATLGYAEHESAAEPVGTSRRAKAALGLLAVGVTVPLLGNTALAYQAHAWQGEIRESTEAWLADEPEARVTGVTLHARRAVVTVRAPSELPPLEELLDRLAGAIPGGIDVSVRTIVGREQDVGRVR